MLAQAAAITDACDVNLIAAGVDLSALVEQADAGCGEACFLLLYRLHEARHEIRVHLCVRVQRHQVIARWNAERGGVGWPLTAIGARRVVAEPTGGSPAVCAVTLVADVSYHDH